MTWTGNTCGEAGQCPSRPALSAALADLTPTGAAFQIISRKAKASTPSEFMAWWKKELKDGGELSEYLRIEKARTRERYRAVAKKQHGFKQNNKSDVRRLADIPARDFFRWLREDPHFFEDNKNLRSLKRDNPDVCVYV